MPLKEMTMNVQPTQRHVRDLAIWFHKDWQKQYKTNNGDKPRLKPTKDRRWIELQGTSEVDIAHTEFEGLPFDWQRENLEAAEVALSIVERSGQGHMSIDQAFIDRAAAEIHSKWLQRVGDGARPDQRVPFEQLSNEEKEKDRQQVRAAIKLLSTSPRGRL